MPPLHSTDPLAEIAANPEPPGSSHATKPRKIDTRKEHVLPETDFTVVSLAAFLGMKKPAASALIHVLMRDKKIMYIKPEIKGRGRPTKHYRKG